MAQIKPEAIEHAVRRFMRPDAHRFIRPDWRRFVRPGQKSDPLYTLYERFERKYSPDQPRVPAGSSEGGQWTNGTGGDSADTESIFKKAKRIAASGTSSYHQCLNLCYPILERFTRPGSDMNTFDFHECMNACLGK
jgi:hypothetical protein